MSSNSTIGSQISRYEELVRLLPLIKSITIIEYDGEDISGTTGLYEYMLSNELSINVVDRIIVCGKKSAKLQQNINMLRALFPSVEPEVTHKEWEDTDFKALNINDVLVFHMANVVGTSEYDNFRGVGVRLHEIVKQTRQAYFVCFLHNYVPFWPFEDESDNCLRCKLRLTDFGVKGHDDIPSPTAFCSERREYIKMCQETLIPKDLFFQCVDEADHGCEECDQCSNYGKMKRCPFAQRVIADCYRQGIYVPKDERIAHEWEAMASRQGYKPAHIQLADDILEGYGCKQSTEAALEIYKEYAQYNDEYCINRIIELAEECEGRERIAAIPYIAQLAKNGNEDMILKLSDAFQNEGYGLPKDIVQQEEWIRKGAENGNPRFVKAMAEMYEANANWADSYKWYKKLAEVCPEMVSDEKLDEIELKMLTNGATDEEIAKKGMDYLYGYYGTERDTHLAYRCLNYAKEKNVPLAIGLLGQMYFYGIEVEQDTKVGLRLLTEATKQDDMLSMEKFIYVLYADKVEDESWTTDMINIIDREILKDNPIACYLKGKCSRDGRLYEKSDMEAFAMMQRAAEMGYPPAQYRLALMYFDGIGTQEDAYRYHQWIETSANNGHYEAKGVYGMVLFNDWRNKSKAFKFLKEAFDQGYEDSDAEWCMAQCYMNGTGTLKNEALAYPMYIKAAEEGKVEAQVKLCVAYFHGNEFLPKDYNECARWGEAALAQGNKSVRFEIAYSSSEIGEHDRAKELYLELSGEGNSAAMNNYACELSDQKEKAEWFQKSADAGSDYGMWNIAKFYRDGTGVEKDVEKALQLFTKAAEKGCKGAIEDLAWMYRYGKGVDIDGEEAVKWYKMAVDKGYHEHLLDLALLYHDGIIVNKDVDLALHYYKQAAEKGIEKALLKLGEMYEKGNGVEINTHKAIFWYRKAAAKGNEEAKECLKRLKTNWMVDGKIEDEFVDDITEEVDDSDDGLLF